METAREELTLTPPKTSPASKTSAIAKIQMLLHHGEWPTGTLVFQWGGDRARGFITPSTNSAQTHWP